MTSESKRTDKENDSKWNTKCSYGCWTAAISSISSTQSGMPFQWKDKNFDKIYINNNNENSVP